MVLALIDPISPMKIYYFLLDMQRLFFLKEKDLPWTDRDSNPKPLAGWKPTLRPKVFFEPKGLSFSKLEEALLLELPEELVLLSKEKGLCHASDLPFSQSLPYDLSYMPEKRLLFGTSKKLCFFVRERDLY